MQSALRAEVESHDEEFAINGMSTFIDMNARTNWLGRRNRNVASANVAFSPSANTLKAILIFNTRSITPPSFMTMYLVIIQSLCFALLISRNPT